MVRMTLRTSSSTRSEHDHGDLGQMPLPRIQDVDARPAGELAGDTRP